MNTASPRQVEYRALHLIDGLAAGRAAAEIDAHTAAFRTWPGPPRAAARRLAAYANAARGRDVLWLIGRPGKGAEVGRLQGWLDTVLPFFDGLAPRVTGFKVPTGTDSVVALQIETVRAPFVIRHGGTCEVPWVDAGEATVRSAGRTELIRLLSPLEDLPQFEVLEAELTFYKNLHVGLGSKAAFRWTLDGSLYVIPRSESRLVIPLHHCRSSVFTPGDGFSSEASDLSLTADKGSPAIRITESAALIEGLGRFFVYACGSTTRAEVPVQSPLSARFDLVPAGTDRAATASAELRPESVTETNQVGRWKL